MVRGGDAQRRSCAFRSGGRVDLLVERDFRLLVGLTEVGFMEGRIDIEVMGITRQRVRASKGLPCGNGGPDAFPSLD